MCDGNRGRGGPHFTRHSAANAAPEKRRGVNHFDDFSEYMQVKMRKLSEQLNKPMAASSGGTIFAGVSIYVDGITTPSNLELRDLIVKHGGDFQYYLVSSVTHIIATHLPDAKVKQLRKEKVVHPDWIIQSCAQGMLLPWQQFAVYRGPLPSQRQLPFASPSPTASAAPPPVSAPPVAPDQPPEDEPPEEEAAYAGEEDDDGDGESNLPPAEDENDEEEDGNGWHSALMGRSMVEREAASFRSKWVQENISTHPDFLRRYFANSRLHFLSTWKNEFVKLVSDMKTQCDLARGASAIAKVPQRRAVGSDAPARLIFHVDMDCFFVSVGIRDRPHLRDKPVGVSHSRGSLEAATAEIASCNYIARQYGVRNGMIDLQRRSLASARKRCSDLQLLPYEFEKYKAVSQKLYKIFFQYADDLQVVSCDEALLDVTSRVGDVNDATAALSLAQKMRDAIFERTGCHASIGASHNILLARLATKKAKPMGQYFLARDQADAFLLDLSVDELPGVGWAISKQLAGLGIRTMRDMRQHNCEELQRVLGQKVGENLYHFARGKDDRPLVSVQPRKTVGAEVNWGIRFEEETQVHKFLKDLAAEVARRLQEAGAAGRTIMLKEKKRQLNFEAPRKFLGCGPCDNFSKSVVLPTATDSAEVIGRECIVLHKALKITALDLRGVGIHLSRLEPARGAASSTAGKPSLLAQAFRHAAPPPAAQGPGTLPAARQAPEPVPAAPLPAPTMTIEDVDAVVFASLPPEVQADVASAFGLSTAQLVAQLRGESEARPSGTRPAAPPATEAPPAPQPAAPASEDDSLLGASTIEGVRDILRQWRQSAAAPLAADVDAVAAFLCKRIQVGYAELPMLALRYLNRLVSDADAAWRDAYHAIVQAVQTVMVARYGHRLAL